MNIANFVARSARIYPERTAVSYGTEPYRCYASLGERVARMAGALRSRYALAPGDRVALAMTNCPEYLEILFAVWHAGLVAVPINARLHIQEIAFILENSGSRVCFAAPDLAHGVCGLRGEVEGFEAAVITSEPEYQACCNHPEAPLWDAPPDAVAWLFYTSGTTGRPKGAMLTHRNLMAMTLSYYADIDSVYPNDCMIHAAPLSHGSGLYALPHVAKAACQVIPRSGGFRPDEIAELVAAHGNASFFFAPSMITRLINHPAAERIDPARLRTIVYGGGPMYLEDLKRARAMLGPCLAQIYGQGESPMTITALPKAWHLDTGHPRYIERLSSVGIPRTDVEVRVADEHDCELPPGQIGEVLVRGDVVMPGYWNNPQANAETLRGGWLHTGDLGVFDADGVLTLKDRSKDLIISGGSNIYSREIEDVLLKHPGIQETSVIGRPHREWGEEVVAFVVPRIGAEVAEAELDALCLAAIARFKRPRSYFFVESLPKNDYGKVLKSALRTQLENSQTPNERGAVTA